MQLMERRLKMYDMIVKHIGIDLTADELDILKEVLEDYQNKCVSVGAQFTLEGLLEKLG